MLPRRDPAAYFDLAERRVALAARSRPPTPLPSHIKRAASKAMAATAFGEARARASARAVVARAAAAEETKAPPADDDEAPRVVSQALVYAVPADYVADDAREANEASACGGGSLRARESAKAHATRGLPGGVGKKLLLKLQKGAEGNSKKFVGEMRKMFFPLQ